MGNPAIYNKSSADSNRNKVWDTSSLSWVAMTQPLIKTDTLTVAGSMSVSNLPASYPVTGDFFPETQPVSGSVSVSNFPGSQAVTGDFYPATQPVSGTFWPDTQPVSGPVTDDQLRATAVPVSMVSVPLPSGASTSASQATLESLIDTLQELIQRLAPLGSAINIAGGTGLRIVGVGGTITASGPLTSAQYTASNLTRRLAVENQTAILANINNCIGA